MNKFNRNNSSRGRDNREDRQMHKTTCSDCGDTCEVPFKPTKSKPVYCNDCFRGNEDRSGSDRGGRGGGRNFRNDDRGGNRNFRNDRGGPSMHRATCSDCGDTCEVPFKPTNSKPVYCSDCFESKGDRPDRSDRSAPSRPDQSNEKHDEIISKLDKILFLLQRKNAVKEITVMKPKKDDVVDAPKKATKKKVVAKKVTAKKKVVKKVATKKAPAKKKAVKKATKKAPAKKKVVKKVK